MRQRLDCAVLLTQRAQAWPGLPSFTGAIGKLHFEPLCPVIDVTQTESIHILAAHAMQLRRFDACLFTATREDLPWARTMLAMGRHMTSTPLILLALDLQPCAINDLYVLGLSDFVRSPCCLDELQLRVYRQRDTAPIRPSMVASSATLEETAAVYDLGGAADEITDASICDTMLSSEDDGIAIFVSALAARAVSGNQSLRESKRCLVSHFERSYLIAALRRNEGNIAQAAKEAMKHRRAFWQLMCKHGVDAKLYRPRQGSHQFHPARTCRSQQSLGRECARRVKSTH